MAIPSISLSFVSGSGCSGSEGATLNVASTVSAQVDSGILVGTYTFTYNLYDSSDNLVSTQVTPGIAFGSNPPNFIFTPTILPFYKVDGIANNGTTSATEEIIINALSPYTIYTDSCANYSVKNCSSSTNLTFKVIAFDGTQVGETQVLNAQTTISFAVPQDGIYYANLYDNTDTIVNTFLVIEYCNILSCISSRIKSILCSCQSSGTSRCTDYCAARYDMNRILPLTYLLFNYLNKEYSLNIIYTAIDNAKIIQLSSINDVISVLQELCALCSDDLSGFEGTVVKSSSSSDCGCGCS